MRVVNLSKKIVDKILFLRVSYVVNVLMLTFALFLSSAIAIISLYFIKEKNYYTYFLFTFFWMSGFLLTIHLIGEKKYVKEVDLDYDDNFISKLNNSLRKELEDDLLKLQEYYDGINVLEYKTFALLKCNSYYEKGKIDEELIDKTKSYYINLFRKKIAKELEEMQKEKERRNILKTNQELILKKIGE
ncbi:hypothetical protein PJO11_001718 [Campylobacter coli]|nr:hypothetical protein [Campylobacter coli]